MGDFDETFKKRLSWKVRKLGFLLDRIAAQTLEEQLRISLAQFRLLMLLRRHGDVSQKAIASFHGLTEAAISRQVDVLMRKGFITRRVNPANRRERLLGLTRKGTAETDKARQLLHAEVDPLFDVLSSVERAQFMKSIDRLLGAIWKDGSRWWCRPRSEKRTSKPSIR